MPALILTLQLLQSVLLGTQFVLEDGSAIIVAHALSAGVYPGKIAWRRHGGPGVERTRGRRSATVAMVETG
jgi:hypothetical protein